MSSFQGDAQGNSTFFEAEEQVETKIVSVYTPLIYSAVLILSLVIFGSQYRKRQIMKKAKLPSIFDENDARDIHLTLKQMNEEQPVHEKVLKAALLNRGAEAIRRSFKMKELEPQINILYKNGSIGEDYWQRYQNEVKLIELEFKQTLEEAQELQPGWLQMFVVVTKEICFNQALARRYNSILKRKEVCAEEWELKLDDNGKLIE
ncbi:SEC66 (YBR171W) [Zygosaccharomyces parabailii]|nr:SEC66 (YBR171W) [Zygosaccharomyces parabailii]CDH12378.1 probable SEC66-ER protein-translocation complex subunit [Zygosaccharomyces bailii ISA1307]